MNELDNMSGKEIYIVTEGEYSSYGIVAVFSKEEDASAYVERHNKASTYGDRFRVETYALDAAIPVDRSGKLAFQITYLDRPSIWALTNKKWYVRGDADKDLISPEVYHEDSGNRTTGEVRNAWITWVWATDEQDALKQGADRIMPVLAEAKLEGVVRPEDEPPDPFDLRDTPFL